jgi:tryptophan synthase alpha chain
MTSVSIMHRMGYHNAAQRFADAGFAGIIVPDAPLDETTDIADAATDAGLALTLLVAPTTPPERAALIARVCTGFVYLLARAGVTGERSTAPAADIADAVANLRPHTGRPIACGFGVATPEHAHAVTRHADAAIVGSAIVRRITEHAGDDPAAHAARFVRDLRDAIDAVDA